MLDMPQYKVKQKSLKHSEAHDNPTATEIVQGLVVYDHHLFVAVPKGDIMCTITFSFLQPLYSNVWDYNKFFVVLCLLSYDHYYCHYTFKPWNVSNGQLCWPWTNLEEEGKILALPLLGGEPFS